MKTLKTKKINSRQPSAALTATELTQVVKKAAFQVTNNRGVFNKKHDEHILKWVGLIGLDLILETIEETDFRKLDYFYTEVDEEICLWEKLYLRIQLSNYEELKEGEYQKVNPSIVEAFAEPKQVWNKDGELKKLQDRHGIRSLEAVAFARKWGLEI